MVRVCFILLIVAVAACSRGFSGKYVSPSIAGTMSLEFQPDNSFTATLGSEKLRGTYNLQGQKITMRIVEISNRPKQASDDKPITGEFSPDKSRLRLDINSVAVEFERR
jgi:hypothetical protein